MAGSFQKLPIHCSGNPTSSMISAREISVVSRDVLSDLSSCMEGGDSGYCSHVNLCHKGNYCSVKIQVSQILQIVKGQPVKNYQSMRIKIS